MARGIECVGGAIELGFGDEILGAGLAKGSAKHGRRVAFSDTKCERIIWHRNAHEIYKGNPNVAPPGSEGADDLEWLIHAPGARAYCRLGEGRKWIFNPGFKAIPGQIYLTDSEREWAKSFGDADVIIEPNCKGVAPNKQWPVERYQEVADQLGMDGYDVAQFDTGPHRLAGVRTIKAATFRLACAAVERAQLYIGPEGGLHHAASALGVGAVVIFGGFISPQVTGYDTHTNLFTGDGLGCGHLDPCGHCRDCMARIGADEVYDAAKARLD
jgi:hypothetical protein